MVGAPLIEREQQVAVLGEALDRAIRGNGNTTLVSGPAGIGKTRLLTHARDDAAARGMRVLHARGADLERAFSFGVARTLLEPVLRAADEDRRRALLAGAAAPAAVVLGLETGSAVDASPALLNAIYWVVAGLTDVEPLAIVVDDLQWTDAPTLRALAFLAHRCDDLRLALLLSVRDGETADDEQALDALHAAAQGVALTGLSADAVGSLLGGNLEADAREVLHRATGGNPLWLQQAGAALTGDTGTGKLSTGALAATVLARLGSLPSDARTVAQAVAVLGDATELHLVAALAGLTPEATLAAADVLATDGLFTQHPALSFAHPILAEAVSRDRGTHALALEHQRAADILQQAGAPPERVAGHVLRTLVTGTGAAVPALTAAADEALRRGDPRAACTYLERALSDVPDSTADVDLRRRLGLAAFQGGRFAQAADLLVPHLADPESEAAILAAAGASCFYTFRPGGSAAPFREAAAACEDPEHRELLLAFARYFSFYMPDGEDGPDLADVEGLTGATLAERLDLASSASLRSETADIRTTSELCARSLGDGALLRAHPALCLIALNSFIGLGMAERHADLERELAHVDQIAAGAAARDAQSVADLARLLVEHQTGQLPAAIARGERMVRYAAVADEAPNALMERVAPAWHLDAVRLHDGAAAAAELAAQLLPPLDGDLAPVEQFAAVWSLPVRALIDLELGRVDEALFQITIFAQITAARSATALLPSWAIALPLALAAAGKDDEALAAAQRIVATEEVFALPSRLGTALRGLARVHPTDSIPLLARAVTLQAGGTAILEEALSRTDLGLALRRAGKRTEARLMLEQASTLAHAAQARPLMAQISEQLHVLGARPRRLAFSGLDSLTASERRAADLAAGGLTNRQIAEQLFVTHKTVEAHLAAVYRKLDVKGRGALSVALAA